MASNNMQRNPQLARHRLGGGHSPLVGGGKLNYGSLHFIALLLQKVNAHRGIHPAA